MPPGIKQFVRTDAEASGDASLRPELCDEKGEPYAKLPAKKMGKIERI